MAMQDSLQTQGVPSGSFLDWNASRRWVHVDNVDSRKVAVFEAARLRWLNVLRRDDLSLPDGRALFWCSRRDSVHTYFTFYPFGDYADLDKRARAIKETERIVGPAAVADCDLGDVSLVLPHFSEIWTQEKAYDFDSPAQVGLLEPNAGAARVEVRQETMGAEKHIASLWSQIAKALAEHRYPMSCRSYFSAFGTGRITSLWLAKDSAEMALAPSVRDILKRSPFSHYASP